MNRGLLVIRINHISKVFQRRMSINYTIHMVFPRPILILKKFNKQMSIWIRMTSPVPSKEVRDGRDQTGREAEIPHERKEQKPSNIHIFFVECVFIEHRCKMSIPERLDVTREFVSHRVSLYRISLLLVVKKNNTLKEYEPCKATQIKMGGHR